MIRHLKGEISQKGDGYVVIDVGGIGFFVYMSNSSLAKLANVGEKCEISCSMSVSDSAIALYGFSAENERVVFEKLISVSGIGPKMALAALSTYTASQLSSLIAAQDSTSLSKIPGIGKKTASRIVLELKDVFQDAFLGSFATSEVFSVDGPLSGVVQALASMGFSSQEISSALEGADSSLPESEILQYALRRLA